LLAHWEALARDADQRAGLVARLTPSRHRDLLLRAGDLSDQELELLIEEAGLLALEALEVEM
ncbi:MAG: hypothetical protein H5T84_08015, partial [Thermoleophilia bacterium]|nr:hypothetical protein [Thermoleophilia bacterium]